MTCYVTRNKVSGMLEKVERVKITKETVSKAILPEKCNKIDGVLKALVPRIILPKLIK